MPEKYTKGEMHGCIVCGRPYELYVVYDSQGRFIDLKVMTPGGRPVPHPTRPLVACDFHSDEQVEAAVRRVYGDGMQEED
ncbi:MAG: hypothetical protein ACM3QS_03545 [Bacteroidota bacterium]